MARGGINKELAATVLIEAVYTTDEKACERYGVSIRSLQRYRKALSKDAELAEVFASKKAAFDREWAETLPLALRSSIECIHSICARLKDDSTAWRNPEMIRVVAGAVLALSEVHFTGRIIDLRFGKSTGGADAGDDQWRAESPHIN